MPTNLNKLFTTFSSNSHTGRPMQSHFLTLSFSHLPTLNSQLSTLNFSPNLPSMKIYYSLILLPLLGSCISVSKQQRDIVQQFASKAEVFSVIPEKISIELADIREIRGVYYANSFSDPATHINELDAIVKERIKNDKIPAKVRSVFNILDKYAEGLVQLSSDTPFKTRRTLFGAIGVDLETSIGYYNKMNVEDKLQAGSGTLLVNLMEAGTRLYLGSRQIKALKKYVNQADTLVSVLCSEMIKYLSSDILIGLISNEASGVHESFGFYFTKRSPPAIESEINYIALMKRVEALKILRLQSIRMVKNLRAAHLSVAEALNQKKSFEEIAFILNEYYHEAETLHLMVANFNTNSKQ